MTALSGLHPLIEQLRQEMGASLRGLDAMQTQLRTANDATRWSIQQIVEHLLLTYDATCAELEKRITRGMSTQTQPTFVQRTAQCAVCRFGYFPYGRESPVAVAPQWGTEPVTGETLAVLVDEALSRMDEVVNETERIFGNTRSAVHHVLGPLRPQQWRRFHLVHGKHHLRQIRDLRVARSA